MDGDLLDAFLLKSYFSYCLIAKTCRAQNCKSPTLTVVKHIDFEFLIFPISSLFILQKVKSRAEVKQ